VTATTADTLRLPRTGGRLGGRPPDQLARHVPLQAHAALGGVHRLGHRQAVRPQVAPEGERRVPVERSGLAERVGDHVRGGERHP